MRIYQVDAFTDKPFRGNPAAVCLLEGRHDDRWMQDVAAEMNLSETAFLEARGDGFGLRWFTPVTEVDLCGHATLASAHVLWEEGEVPGDQPISFHTASGRLTAERKTGTVWLDFPADLVEPDPGPAHELAVVLGATPVRVARGRFLVAELTDEEAVRTLSPDLRRMKELGANVTVTAGLPAGAFDFVSRTFGPAVGIDEDPVTGSAHCALGPYWSERLGRDELVGYQASRRGGTVRVRVVGNRVVLGGSAVTVVRGTLL